MIILERFHGASDYTSVAIDGLTLATSVFDENWYWSTNNLECLHIRVRTFSALKNMHACIEHCAAGRHNVQTFS
jgi:hypothetical protein